MTGAQKLLLHAFGRVPGCFTGGTGMVGPPWLAVA